MSDADGQVTPTTARRLFAQELVRLRREHGLSLRELAPRVMQSRSLIGEVERGQRWPPPELAQQCDALFSTAARCHACGPPRAVQPARW